MKKSPHMAFICRLAQENGFSPAKLLSLGPQFAQAGTKRSKPVHC
jgi:hypothetical protein